MSSVVLCLAVEALDGTACVWPNTVWLDAPEHMVAAWNRCPRPGMCNAVITWNILPLQSEAAYAAIYVNASSAVANVSMPRARTLAQAVDMAAAMPNVDEIYVLGDGTQVDAAVVEQVSPNRVLVYVRAVTQPRAPVLLDACPELADWTVLSSRFYNAGTLATDTQLWLPTVDARTALSTLPCPETLYTSNLQLQIQCAVQDALHTGVGYEKQSVVLRFYAYAVSDVTDVFVPKQPCDTIQVDESSFPVHCMLTMQSPVSVDVLSRLFQTSKCCADDALHKPGVFVTLFMSKFTAADLLASYRLLYCG